MCQEETVQKDTSECQEDMSECQEEKVQKDTSGCQEEKRVERHIRVARNKSAKRPLRVSRKSAEWFEKPSNTFTKRHFKNNDNIFENTPECILT